MEQLVVLACICAVGRQHGHKFLEVDALEKVGQSLGQWVDGELGDAEELSCRDEALQARQLQGGEVQSMSSWSGGQSCLGREVGTSQPSL